MKPPTGLKPKNIHDEERLEEITLAMVRYTDANLKVPEIWKEEYVNLYNQIRKYENDNKTNHST